MSLKHDIATARKSRDRVEKLLREKEAEERKLTAKRKKLKRRDPSVDAIQEKVARQIARLHEEIADLNARITSLENRKDDIVSKIKRLVRRWKAKRRRYHYSAGAPHWGGSDDIIRREVDPVAKRYGAPLTSRKRSATDPLTLANPGSDHSALATYASAADYGTFSGAKLAHSIAAKLGIGGYSTGNYNGYYIVRDGRTFRVQILWAVDGHFNHVHVGIRQS